MGDVRPHGHLKMGRFTQHFIDVLDLDLTPLEFFEQTYLSDAREDLRKYLGRFGVSGKMQMQKMAELSDGQKSRVVFAKLGRDVPHILLLDEPYVLLRLFYFLYLLIYWQYSTDEAASHVIFFAFVVSLF
jgi:ATP-binding cassette subfamily F protein 2